MMQALLYAVCWSNKWLQIVEMRNKIDLMYHILWELRQIHVKTVFISGFLFCMEGHSNG